MKTNVLQYLEESARLHPDSPAVIDEGGTTTYAQLHATSRRVGSALAKSGVRSHGVIVAMEKSADALAAQLGAMYAGGFYVPVDPETPAERLEAIVAALGGALLIADDSSQKRIADMCLEAVTVRFSDISQYAIDDQTLAEIRRASLETDPAYALFTSGSTGVPKGVVTSHRAVLSFIDSFVETFQFRETDRFANQAPFDFDVSTKDIYASLATSATLVVVPRKLFMQPADLATYLEAHRVTVLIWAVAALCLFSTYHGLKAADLSTIRSVLFSGEIMPAKHLKSWRGALPQAMFANLYGPTETTCNCLYHILDADDDYAEGIPLGVPFGHCDVLLVDDGGRAITQPGVEGELLVRGPSLALGYLGQRELTNRAFTQNPTNSLFPDRVYRTGDVAVLDEQGRLFFRGRKDNQIKHLGHRIELEEIDLAFERFPGVDRCRCAYDSTRKLVRAYYEGPADERDLPVLARKALPAFMLPASIRHVTDMPLNKNGKVDRSRLLTCSTRASKVMG